MSDYAETSALLAILNDDEGEAARIIADFFPNERLALAFAASRLALLAESSVCPQCTEQVKPDEAQYAVGISSPRQRYHRACWERTR